MPPSETKTGPADHVVQEGETLRSIASLYGFVSWKTIFEHEANAALRAQRKYPGLLRPGDKLHIPAKQASVHQCRTGATYQFRLKPTTDVLTFIVKDDSGLPYATCKYALLIEGRTYEGTTDENGVLCQEVPVSAQKATLK